MKRCEGNREYQDQFFSYFEHIIHNELPDLDNVDELQDPSFEPRIERPPCPPNVNIPLDPSVDQCTSLLDCWENVFATQVKLCREKFQRHVHKRVCFKYDHTTCRFHFPHEEVLKSYFDEDSNAIIFVCKDGQVNNFNPYLLVFSRHNHDIKCILSGQAAKSAMIYITDYITKMDMRTYEMLTLLSKAIVSNNAAAERGADVSAKTLLHKCITQFTKCQQIHGQQAAWFLRLHKDTISSHSTVPMLSGLLMSYVKDEYQSLKGDNAQCCTADDNEDDSTFLPVIFDENRRVVQSNQIHDYLYRDEALSHVCFYDYVRCFRLVKVASKNRRSGVPFRANVRCDAFPKFKLKVEHDRHLTHEVEQFNDIALNSPSGQELIPRVIGCRIPRRSNYRIVCSIYASPLQTIFLPRTGCLIPVTTLIHYFQLILLTCILNIYNE